jgi:excisionase family DNA binding protein
MNDDLISIEEACELLEVSRPTFAKMKKELNLTPHPFGQRQRFSKREILEKISNIRPPARIKALLLERFNFDELWPINQKLDLDCFSLIDAFSATSLLCLALTRSKLGLVVDLHSKLLLNASYLSQMYFFHHLAKLGEGNVIIDSRILNASMIHPEIILPISQVGFKGAERKYSENLKGILKQHGFSEDIGHYIGWSLGELADNSHTHANTKGFCFISIERLIGKYNFLQINISDMGEGIPKTLKRNPKYSELDDETALLMAFKSNVSSWGDEFKRGKGLTDILKIAFECNSFLKVESGDLAYMFYCQDERRGIEKAQASTYVPGTRFSITLIDNHFKEIERAEVNKFIDTYLGEL